MKQYDILHLSSRAPRKIDTVPSYLYPLLYYRKQIFLLLLGIPILFLAIAFCDYNNPTGMAKFVLSMYDKIFDVSSISGFQKLLLIKQNGASLKLGNYNMNAVMSVLNVINNIFVNIGTCLLLIYWGMSFFDMLMQNNNQLILEQMIRKFIFLVVGVALVTNGKNIVFLIVNMGTEVVSSIAGKMDIAYSSPAISAVRQSIYESCSTAEGQSGLTYLGAVVTDLMTTIGYLVEMFIPYLFTLVCQLLISVICWSRFIEICMMATIAPVMFSDLSHEHFLHTNTAKAIRSIIALSLSGAMMLLSLYICSMASASILRESLGVSGSGAVSSAVLTAENYISVCYDQVIIGVVRLGMIAKAQAISKQALGLA